MISLAVGLGTHGLFVFWRKRRSGSGEAEAAGKSVSGFHFPGLHSGLKLYEIDAIHRQKPLSHELRSEQVSERANE